MSAVHSFQAKIHSLSSALTEAEKHLLIDDRLQVIQKGGFTWCLLSLLAPICSRLGWDLYAPVRADRVAQHIFLFCEENKKELNQVLVDEVIHKVISPLNKKTNEKYHKPLVQIADKIVHLLPKSKLNWPTAEKLKEMGITPEEKKVLDRQLVRLIEEMSLVGDSVVLFDKTGVKGDRTRSIQLVDSTTERVISGFFVPHTVSLKTLPNGKDTFILLGKEVIAKGGERVVKSAFDLVHGVPYVKKTVVTRFEEQIYQYLQKILNTRGVPTNFFFRRVGGKTQILEPQYVGSLQSCLGSPALDSWEEKERIILDLLTGLQTLHSISFANGGDGTYPFKQVIPNYHGDIKGGNILVDLVNGPAKAIWTDFGLSSQVCILGGTPGFQSPKKVELLAKKACNPSSVTIEEIANFHLQFGQSEDVWAMGLIILVVFLNDPKRDIPLQCILKGIENSGSQPIKDFSVKGLTQEQVDMELRSFPLRDRIAVNLINVVGKMLRIDPKERISIADALVHLS